jgi:hypothetical protein
MESASNQRGEVHEEGDLERYMRLKAQVMSTFAQDEQRILIARYGTGNMSPCSLETTARDCNTPVHRVKELSDVFEQRLALATEQTRRDVRPVLRPDAPSDVAATSADDSRSDRESDAHNSTDVVVRRTDMKTLHWYTTVKRKVLATHTSDERTIIIARYGTGYMEPWSADAIARKLKLPLSYVEEVSGEFARRMDVAKAGPLWYEDLQDTPKRAEPIPPAIREDPEETGSSVATLIVADVLPRIESEITNGQTPSSITIRTDADGLDSTGTDQPSFEQHHGPVRHAQAWEIMQRFSDWTEKGIIVHLYGVDTGIHQSHNDVAKALSVPVDMVKTVDLAARTLLPAMSAADEPSADGLSMIPSAVWAKFDSSQVRILRIRYGMQVCARLPGAVVSEALGIPLWLIDEVSDAFEQRLATAGLRFPEEPDRPVHAKPLGNIGFDLPKDRKQVASQQKPTKEEIRRLNQSILATFDGRDADIVDAIYGISNARTQSYTATARRFDVPIETVHRLSIEFARRYKRDIRAD